MVALINLQSFRTIPRWPLVIACGYLLTGWLALQQYLDITGLSFLIGCLTLPFTVRTTEQKNIGPSGLTGFLLLLGLCLLVPVQSILYLLFGAGIFLLLQNFGYRAGLRSWLVWMLMSPASSYAAQVFGFPIRMQLSSWAGSILNLYMQDITVQGPTIFYQGNEFAVDAACMGLNMLVSSFLLGLMLLGFREFKAGKRLGLVSLIGYLVLILALTIIANMIRILVLIQFLLLPEDPLHELTGLACMLIYVALPAAWLASWLMRFGHKVEELPPTEFSFQPKLQVFILMLVAGAAVYVRSVDTYSGFGAPPVVAGYRSMAFAPGIVKLENKTSLVYIKYIRGFYDSDHNPTLCWKGSGYQFRNIRELRWGPDSWYTARLEKGNEQLYTAWWYGNNKLHTNSHLTWRRNMLLHPGRYALVNITAASPEELQKEMEVIMHSKKLDPFFVDP